jgi:hypothetical protein
MGPTELCLTEYRVLGRVPGAMHADAIRAPGPEQAARAWCRWWDETMCDTTQQLLSAPELPHMRREAKEILVDVHRPDTGESWLVAVKTWLEPRYEIGTVV